LLSAGESLQPRSRPVLVPAGDIAHREVANY